MLKSLKNLQLLSDVHVSILSFTSNFLFQLFLIHMFHGVHFVRIRVSNKLDSGIPPFAKSFYRFVLIDHFRTAILIFVSPQRGCTQHPWFSSRRFHSNILGLSFLWIIFTRLQLQHPGGVEWRRECNILEHQRACFRFNVIMPSLIMVQRGCALRHCYLNILLQLWEFLIHRYHRRHRITLNYRGFFPQLIDIGIICAIFWISP